MRQQTAEYYKQHTVFVENMQPEEMVLLDIASQLPPDTGPR